ncbi:2Fe-2S iron-sulfur cluster-binding protein [Flaviflagellibacter deserti]|uniref:2Fe-2S iron-sulfur cluster-binding protein n=1 Tax=Flaviflagellibacter deserti TaxID=2267266 RepID=A0ABV9YY85_9HYPH
MARARRNLRVPEKEGSNIGRLIDRTQPISFTFNGRAMKGFAGDTVASALIANDVRRLTSSFKYHRPRGVLGIGSDDPNAIVEIGVGDRRTPNLNATQVLLAPDMRIASQNVWPSPRLDLGGLIGRLKPLMPPSFQYKTFKWPVPTWRVYEKALRTLGGIGTVPGAADPDRYEHIHVDADVLIVGGGLAGIAAAEAASAADLKVVLVEETHRLGGIADGYDGRVDGKPLLDWVQNKVRNLAASRDVHILTNAGVAGLYDHGLAIIHERLDPNASVEPENAPRERIWKLRTKAVILATGAHEKPLVFPDNDRPGIMLATAARLYLRRYGVLPGQRVVIATTGDEGYRTAADLAAGGAEIVRVVDLRLDPDGSLFHIMKARGTPLAVGSAPVGTTKGKKGELAGVTIANRLTLDGPALRSHADADTLLVSGGWGPAPFLAGHLGARLVFDEELGGFRPGELPGGLFVAGAANGKFHAAEVLEDGWRAGSIAVEHVLGSSWSSVVPSHSIEVTADDDAEPVGMLPDVATAAERATAFVDLQNDVTIGDLDIAIREGYSAPEHLKRYTTLGQGVDQGKLAVANAAMVMAKALPNATPAHTTFRPPWTPITFGAIAGTRRGVLFKPVRETPLTALTSDALREPLGLWRPPAVFPRPGESREEAVRREARSVRNGVGLFDATLGVKIAVQGPDAAQFLDRMSATNLADLEVGRSRFALFLDNDGFVLEDAVIARAENDRFIVSAGIGRADNLCAWFERWRQREWPDLNLFITDETERWGQLLLAGPRVPELLAAASSDIDIAGFETDSYAEGEFMGTTARALATRYTATPEVEIAVPAGHLPSLWEQITEAGKPLGITHFGTDTLHRLRLEGGAFDLDHETDGSVTPYDLGLGDLVKVDKPFFVGKEGLERPGMTRSSRRHLVGVLTEDPSFVPPPGAHLVLDPDHAPPRRVVGHVTSSGYSPTLRRSLALALISAGERHIGDRVFIVSSGEGLPAIISSTAFFSNGEPT